MVVEKLEELEQIIRTSKEVGVEPMIGIRVRLNSKGAGKWTTSGGENAKFGLDTAEPDYRQRNIEERGTAALPQAGPFSYRLAGSGYFNDQARGAGSSALLREDRQDGPRNGVPRRGRRSGSGLRRLAYRLSIARPTIRCRNTPTTSSGTSWMSAIPKASASGNR